MFWRSQGLTWTVVDYGGGRYWAEWKCPVLDEWRQCFVVRASTYGEAFRKAK